MRIRCPSCSKTFQVPREAAGKVHCPHCAQKLDLSRMERPDDLTRGDKLGGCRVEGLLGRGGMAVVYKATQLSLDRPVALKVLPRKLAADRQFVERFNREASALARLSHPNIVSILDKGVESDTYYFVMEFVEGRSLRELLRGRGSLPPDEALELMNGVCAALEYAHETGIVHRDLKPSNILLDGSGAPKLADFGIARIIGGQTTAHRELTLAHSAMGSADYMAPEQREDAASVDHRADIYALGVLVYQMLTGRLPVGTFTPASKLNAAVPAATDRVIRKALASSPAERFESVALFRAALSQALTAAPAHGMARDHPRGSSSRTAQVLVVLGVLAACAIFGALIVAQQRRGGAIQPPPQPKPPTTAPAKPRPKPPTPLPPEHPRKPPKPEGEPEAVKIALADVRSYIAQNPTDYQGQVQRLNDLILKHSDPAIAAAARKERDAAVARLTAEIDQNLTQLTEQAGALADHADYGAALRVFEVYPGHLRTEDAIKRLNTAAEDVKARAFIEFRKRQDQAAKLAAAGKATEAAELLEEAKGWGLPDIAEAAGKQLAELSAAVAAEARRVAEEQRALREKLAEDLKALWAERKYAEALDLVGPALDQAPNEAARAALARYQRAAALMVAFWRSVERGAELNVGKPLRINGTVWNVVAYKDGTLQLATGGGEGEGKIGRSLRSLKAHDLASLALYGSDRTNADTQLMLALFHTHDHEADPAAAKKAFEAARSRGARKGEIEALSTLGVEQAARDPQAEPADAGFCLDLNGTADHVVVEDKPPLHLRTFTVEAWVWHRPGGAATQYLVAKNLGAAGALSYGIGVRGGSWVYATGFGAEPETRITAAACPAGTWVHCALVCAGLDRALFVNGKLADSSRASQMWSVDDQPLTIGAKFGTEAMAYYWNGAIDELRISMVPRYRKDFAPERRLEPDRQTVLLLRFDEGEGGIARDATKFRHHGTINGARFVPPDALRLPPPPKPLAPGKGEG